MKKGSRMSIESRLKMSLTRKMLPSNFKGKHHTKETKLLIGLKQTGTNNHNYGKPMPEEQKLKIKIANTGKKLSKESIEKIRQTKLSNNLLLTTEELSKRYGVRKGTKQSIQEKTKRSKSLKEYYINHPEILERKRQLMKDYYSTPESRIKQSEISKKALASPEVRARMSKSIKQSIINDPSITKKANNGCKLFHKNHPEFASNIGKKSFLGKKHTEESKLKMSKTHIGSNNAHWQGGFSIQYPFEFNHNLKETVRQRDNYQCKICHISQNSQRLSIHHIDYDKYNLNLDNLISLCRSCHQKTNLSREHWKQYFKNIVTKEVNLE